MTVVPFSPLRSATFLRRAREAVAAVLAGDPDAFIPLGDLPALLAARDENGEVLIDLGGGDALLIRVSAPEDDR